MTVKPVLPTLKHAPKASLEVHVPAPSKVEPMSPEVEEMEVVTSQLSRKLCIEDIDAVDSENPQLCAEYVKEIYEYMMMLEVRR